MVWTPLLLPDCNWYKMQLHVSWQALDLDSISHMYLQNCTHCQPIFRLILLFVFKSLNCLKPAYIVDLLCPYVPIPPYISRPVVSKLHCSTRGDVPFQFAHRPSELTSFFRSDCLHLFLFLKSCFKHLNTTWLYLILCFNLYLFLILFCFFIYFRPF